MLIKYNISKQSNIFFNKGFIKILSFFKSGSERTLKTKKNISYSAILRLTSLFLGLLTVPLILDLVDKTQYGLFLTISSVINMINLLDIGLGGGLRNRLTENFADKELSQAKIYISTTYFALVVIIILLFSLFIPLSSFVDWNYLLNAPREIEDNIGIVVNVLFISFCLQFVLKLIGTVFIADQKQYVHYTIMLLSNLLVLISVFILKMESVNSLIVLSCVIGGAPIIVYLIFSIGAYRTIYRAISPSISSIKINQLRRLSNLAIQFFIIQIASVVVFSSSNLFISHFLSPSEVTPYNLSYRLFSSASMFFFMITTPLISSFTDAFHKSDFEWIKNAVRKLVAIWIFNSLLLIIILIASPYIFNLWIGGKVFIPFELSALLVIYMIFMTFNSIFTTFLNGIGKVRLQLVASILEMLFFLPIAYIVAILLQFKINGLVIASSIPLIIGAFWTFIQYRKIVFQNAKGIWNK